MPLLREFRTGSALGALSLALLALPAASHAASGSDDEGTFRVEHRGKYLGIEDFLRHNDGAALVVESTARQILPGEGSRSDTLTKAVKITLGPEDGDLRDYESREYFHRRYVRRQLSMSDTTYTSYRLEAGVRGFGDSYPRPPGRIYVVDPQVFVLFDVLCRDMSQQSFEERPITLLYIAADHDTAVEARVKRLGTEPLKLGGRTYTAERFGITDAWSQYYMWASVSGRMLKFTYPSGGLVVERDPSTLPAPPRPARAPGAPPKRAAAPSKPAEAPPKPLPPPGR